MYARLYALVCVYVCVFVCMYVCAFVRAFVCVYMCICVYMCVYVCICAYIQGGPQKNPPQLDSARKKTPPAQGGFFAGFFGTCFYFGERTFYRGPQKNPPGSCWVFCWLFRGRLNFGELAFCQGHPAEHLPREPRKKGNVACVAYFCRSQKIRKKRVNHY